MQLGEGSATACRTPVLRVGTWRTLQPAFQGCTRDALQLMSELKSCKSSQQLHPPLFQAHRRRVASQVFQTWSPSSYFKEKVPLFTDISDLTAEALQCCTPEILILQTAQQYMQQPQFHYREWSRTGFTQPTFPIRASCSCLFLRGEGSWSQLQNEAACSDNTLPHHQLFHIQTYQKRNHTLNYSQHRKLVKTENCR